MTTHQTPETAEGMTPRTDKAVAECAKMPKDGTAHAPVAFGYITSHAMGLERELASARAEVERLKAKLLDEYCDDGTPSTPLPEPGEFVKWLESDAALQWKGKQIAYEIGKGVVASGDTLDSFYEEIKDRPNKENIILGFVPDPDVAHLPFAAQFHTSSEADELRAELSTANAARRDEEAKVDEMRGALEDFDNSRCAAQSTVPAKSRQHHADILIDRVRAILSTTIPGKSRVAELERLQRQLVEKCSLIGRIVLERDTALARVEWLWKNCRIIYFPEGINAYPIEHQPFCDKDGRKFIEPIMEQALTPTKAASVEAEKVSAAGKGHNAWLGPRHKWGEYRNGTGIQCVKCGIVKQYGGDKAPPCQADETAIAPGKERA